ncbi:MAG TPA: hypothetical protein VIZ61_07180 [Solirubrobacterales bacterium]
MEATASRIEPGRVIGEAFETYRNNAGALLGVAVLILGVVGIANGLLRTSDSVWLALVASIISLVAHVLYTGYVVKLVQDVRDGRRDDTVGDLLSAAAPYIGTLILNGILFGIAVAIGLFLLIVPGLILITIWAVVAPSIVVENRGVIEAFGRSRELVRGNGWNVFGVILIAFLIVIAVYVIATLIGAAIGNAGLVILSVVASIVAEPLVALVSSVLFFDLGGGQGMTTSPAEMPATEPPPPPEAPAA